jgi:hypothetical protein
MDTGFTCSVGIHFDQPDFEILVNHEITSNQIKESGFPFQSMTHTFKYSAHDALRLGLVQSINHAL